MRVQVQGAALTLELSGEIDHHSAAELRDKVDKAYERSGCKHIVFDFTDVAFMDSSGIGMIIGRYKNAEKRGGQVALAGMCREVQRIFDISGLSKIARAYATPAEAVRELESEARHG